MTKDTSRPKNWNPEEHYKDLSIAENYDSQRFSSLPGRVFEYRERRAILQAFSTLPRGSTIIDAPCGTGRLSETLLDAGYTVVGIDISPQMLNVAERRLSRFGNRFSALCSDVRNVADVTEPADAVLCARFLMHFPLGEQIEFLKSLRPLARRFMVFNQSVNTPYHRLRRLFKRALRHQMPAEFPITPAEINLLSHKVGLPVITTFSVLPLVSEAVVVRCTSGT